MLITFSSPPPLLFSFLLEIHAWPFKFANQPFKLFFFWFHPFFSIFLIDFSNLILFSISSSFKFLICQIRFLFFWFFYLRYLFIYLFFNFILFFFHIQCSFFFQFNSSILNCWELNFLIKSYSTISRVGNLEYQHKFRRFTWIICYGLK